jgi:hypothetical protein
MNLCSSSSPDWPAHRIARVLKSLDELNRCVAERGRHAKIGTRWGLTVGEMDWRSELHNEIFGTQKLPRGYWRD